MYFFFYIVILIALGLHLPDAFTNPESKKFIFILGALGLWRYGWGAFHFFRSILYRKFIFPRWRRLANSPEHQRTDQHVFLLMTSFRIDTHVTVRVYREAIREAISSGKKVTLVASIVEMADQRLIKSIFLSFNPPSHIQLKFVRIQGTGKRDALASGFTAIARLQPRADDLVAVIDGDSIITPGLINNCASLFSLNEKLGALTTDEDSEVEEHEFSDGIYRRWYSMRFAQRHILMSSMGLSRRVLTLTGRMSMFRAGIVVQPDFIETVREDHIDHWRLGRFRFLTGDDKSTWYYTLKNGWEMIYVPDVQVITIEEPPSSNFFKGATVLMMRWFGNMLRTNSRALAIPRAKIGTFVWWCLIDQRLSMWTSLVGPTAALYGTIAYGFEILFVYIFWIGFTRLVQTTMLLSARPRVSISYPFFLYFNQIYGSLIKVYILCHLNRQKWTRQKTVLASGQSRIRAYLQHQASNFVLVTYSVIFLTSVAFFAGIYDMNDINNFMAQIHARL